MEYYPSIKIIITDKKEPTEIEVDVNDQVKRFLRSAPGVHPKQVGKLERVSASQYVLHYYSAT